MSVADFDLLITNGFLVTEQEVTRADIGVRDGRIASIARSLLASRADRVIDASGMLVMPGCIDAHVHFQLRINGDVTADDFSSGTRAAACGGVTTILDYTSQAPGQSLTASVEARRAQADPQVCIDYGLHVSVMHWSSTVCGEMATLVEQGLPSFKFFTIYEERGWRADARILGEALSAAAKLGATICLHAEDHQLIEELRRQYAPQAHKYGAYTHALTRPCRVELNAVKEALQVQRRTGGRLYFVHLSTGEALDAIGSARRQGQRVIAETCPQYLTLTDEVLRGPNGYLYATCPQVKHPHDVDRLWRGVLEGEVDVIATDHCAWTSQQKSSWQGDYTRLLFGLPGVETLLPLLHHEGVNRRGLTYPGLVRLLAANPARIHGLYPRKGVLREGSDADMVIFDHKRRLTIRADRLCTSLDWSPYEGVTVTGWPHITILRGTVVARDGTFTGKPGAGMFLPRKPAPAETR